MGGRITGLSELMPLTKKTCLANPVLLTHDHDQWYFCIHFYVQAMVETI